MTLNYLFSKLKGGAGSGNIGHSGRPGHRGGSAPKSEAPVSDPSVVDTVKGMHDEHEKTSGYSNHLQKGFTGWKGNLGKPPGCKVSQAKPNLCHHNALAYVKENEGATLGIGFYVDPSKENPKQWISTGDHSWVFQNGKLYDPTIGGSSWSDDKNMLYVGTEISRATALKIKDKVEFSNAVFSYTYGTKPDSKTEKEIMKLLKDDPLSNIE